MATLRSYAALIDELEPFAHWRFDETSGVIAFDRISGFNGRYQGNPTLDAGFIGDGASRVDGTGDFVEVVTATAEPVRLGIIGDSLVEGFGLAPADAFPDDLVETLELQGFEIEPIVDGRSGQRVDQMLANGSVGNMIEQDHPDAVILVLGTNDSLQGRDPVAVKADFRTMIAQYQAADVDVLLTSTYGLWPDVTDNHGYGEPGALNDRPESAEVLGAEFEAMFPALGQEFGIDVFGPFTAPVRENPAAFNLQVGGVPDGVHPNATGVDQIVARILPQASALVRGAQESEDPLALASGSFEIWFRPNALATQALFSKDAAGTGAGQILAALGADGSISVALETATARVPLQTAAGLVGTGEATQLVVAFGPGGLQLFVNGLLVATDAFAGGLTDNTEPLLVGRAGAGDVADFAGVIDEFVLHDQKLDETEVAALYAAGIGGGRVTGTDGADLLVGGADDEVFEGRGGRDEIAAGDGDDRLLGGPGADILRGEGGDDVLIGGSGADLVEGGDGRDKMTGKGGQDRMLGGAGDDELRGLGAGDVALGGEGDDLIQGGSGADKLKGGPGADLLEGGSGRDVLRGNGGADRLFGDGGRDDLRGNGGADLLDGGADDDRLVGGADADTFRISALDHGVDEVVDFEAGPGGDVLDLRAVLDFGAGDDAADFVELIRVKGDTKVAVDPDGVGDDSVVVFNLLDVTGLSVADLVADGNILT